MPNEAAFSPIQPLKVERKLIDFREKHVPGRSIHGVAPTKIRKL